MSAIIENAIETGVGIRVADPLPAYCSNCHNSTSEGYVSFPAAHDAGQFVNPPEGEYVAGSDDLYLCFACVRHAAEVVGFKPGLHARQRREISRLELQAAHWKDYAKRIEQAVASRPQEEEGS